MRPLRPAAAVLALGALSLGATAPASAAPPSNPTFAGKVTQYVDPAQQTALGFGDRSHWHLPWRAYLDTVPATRLRDAVGIQFNVSAAEADATARLLAANGFRRARVEQGWGGVSYDDPSRLADPADFRTKLQALNRHGIRPLILLNAHHGGPTPSRPFSATLMEPAARGARRVRVDAGTLAQIVPGRSGLELSGEHRQGDVLFTAVDTDGWAELARPLPTDLPAGAHPAVTLRYEPFARPGLADGSANPDFEETMGGWLAYVGAVTREAKQVLGSDAFDVEIWNELSFGSDFLDADNYYSPPVGRTYASVVHETPGLLSYWRLNEGLGSQTTDSRGTSDGTHTSGVRPGAAGALTGDQSSSAGYVGGWTEVPDRPSLDLADRMSLEAWVRRDSSGANHTILGKGSGAYVLWLTGDRLTLRKSHVGNIAQSTVPLMADRAWHHVAATKNGADVHLYVDGADVTGPVIDRTLTDTAEPLRIGTNTGGDSSFRGRIDEVAVYAAPLSAADVSAHHAAGRLDPALTQGSVDREILHRTTAWLRDPANAIGQVGIANGFASQRPWDAGSTSPPGLTALSKHPYLYSGMRRFFPGGAVLDETRPLSALGGVDGSQLPSGDWSETFTPTYDSFHPEYYLWGTHKVQRYDGFPLAMDNLVRDLSPRTTLLNGVEHGRATHPPGAQPPEMWITEMNIDPAGAPASFGLGPNDRLRFQAKAALRTMVAFVNKGVSAIDLYSAKDGNFSLVSNGFYDAVAGGAYPGDRAGGVVMDSMARLVAGFAGAVPLAAPRQVSLFEIGDYAGNRQFEGDGTAAHPPLYNRDVLAFLPFQVTPKRFVIPVYVMTTNLAKVYKPTAPPADQTRFDLPAETYRLTIGGVAGKGASVSATDPLTGQAVPVKVISGSGGQLVVELPVTDSPRLLAISER